VAIISEDRTNNGLNYRSCAERFNKLVHFQQVFAHSNVMHLLTKSLKSEAHFASKNIYVSYVLARTGLANNAD